jgi:hypothetical protein
MLTDWDEDERLLIRVWDGTVGADEWARVGPNAWSFPDMRRMLADLSRWERDPSIDSTMIAAMAERLATGAGARSIRLAILATREFWAAHEFAAAFSQHRSNASVVVFDLETACIWLGIDTAVTQSRIDALVKASA